MPFDFAGRRVVVAGGSRGIGRAIALNFAAAGAHVSICARGAATLEATRAEIAAHGHPAHAAPCDLADAASVAGYVQAAAQALGGIDVLVNNASGFGMGDDEAGWAAGLSVDVMAMVRASHAALPWLQKSGPGRVGAAHLVDLGLPPVHAIGRLRGGEGGDEQLHRQPGRDAQPPGHPRERHRPGLDRIPRRRVGPAQAGRRRAVRPHAQEHSLTGEKASSPSSRRARRPDLT